MLIYSQRTGQLKSVGRGVSLSTATLLGTGYSGKGLGKNNPDAQGQQGIGPIPRGFYRIGIAYMSQKTGPVTIPLYALDGNPMDDVEAQTLRSAFRMHGDNATGTASEGCIIQNRPVREHVANGSEEILWVVE